MGRQQSPTGEHMQVKRGEHLNEHANFETFPSAVLLLFRIATADEWTGIMSDASVAPPDCDVSAGNCGTRAAPVYIMSFALIIGQIVLNLFSTIVIETFEEMDEVRLPSLRNESLTKDCIILTTIVLAWGTQAGS